MKITLSLTGSPAAITAAMIAFEEIERNTLFDGATRKFVTLEGNAPTATASTDTGAGTAAPMPLPLQPNGVATTQLAPVPSMMPMPTITPIGEDEEAGEASDGSGLDVEGLPWDERIHTSTKTKSAKGVWTKRRGAPKGQELAAIEAELRAGGGVAPVPMPVPLAPMQPVAPAPSAPVAPVPLPIPQPMPTPAAAPEPAPQPPVPMPVTAPTPLPMPVASVAPEPAAAVSQEWDFASFMQAVGPKMGEAEGQINPAYLTQVCAHYGLGSITDLAPKPEMIATIVAQFQADNRW